MKLIIINGEKLKKTGRVFFDKYQIQCIKIIG